MLDIKLLRKDPQALEAKLKTKDPEVHLAPLIALDERIRHVIGELEQLQSDKEQLRKRKATFMEMEDMEDTTMGVQIEEKVSDIRTIQIVTKLWVSVWKRSCS